MPIWCRIHIIISIKHCINFILYENFLLLFSYVVCHSYFEKGGGGCKNHSAMQPLATDVDEIKISQLSTDETNEILSMFSAV